MFYYIKGKLVRKEHALAVIDVQGVGYELKISLNTHEHLQLGEECKLYCYLHIKDDGHTLYGFWEEAEKRLFLHLTSISGVGPSTGLMMLSSLSVHDIQQAIVGEDVKTVQSVKGIGTKTAQRIILELKDKLVKEGVFVGSTSSANGTMAITPASVIKSDAVEALTALGLPKATAEKSVTAVLKKKPDASVEDIVRMALRS